jgi:uncharacterized damage-inducible protein DinB
MKVATMKDTVIDGLQRQFISSCKMLRNAVANVPDEKWHHGAEGWFFSLTAYHIVETLDFYLRKSPDGMRWGAQAGFDWDESKDTERDILPKITKGIVEAYLDEVEGKLTELLSSLGIKDLSNKDDFPWFTSIFEKLIYVLRHTTHHAGELSKTLRDWQCKRVEWI